MGNLIIVDRKKKKASFDNQFTDPLGVDEAKREKARTIDIPNDSTNPIHKFLRLWDSPKLLLGRCVHCLIDKKEVLSGYIVDVIPPFYLHLKDKGVVKFSDVVSMENE